MKRGNWIVAILASMLAAPAYATGAPVLPAKSTATKKATSRPTKAPVARPKPSTTVVTRVVERIVEKPVIVEKIVYVSQDQTSGKLPADVSVSNTNNNTSFQLDNNTNVNQNNNNSSANSNGNYQPRVPPAPTPAPPVYIIEEDPETGDGCPDPLEVILVQVKPFKKARTLHPGMYRLTGGDQDTFLTIPGERPEISLHNAGDVPRLKVGTIVKLLGKRGYEYYVLALDYPLASSGIDLRELKPARKDYYEFPSDSEYVPAPKKRGGTGPSEIEPDYCPNSKCREYHDPNGSQSVNHN